MCVQESSHIQLNLVGLKGVLDSNFVLLVQINSAAHLGLVTTETKRTDFQIMY